MHSEYRQTNIFIFLSPYGSSMRASPFMVLINGIEKTAGEPEDPAGTAEEASALSVKSVVRQA
ncbi:hypothetical protein BA724_02925 [Domibacillus iocasae]|uniref:Uncharacterized protein n=1 Tax=Domibacillus iocasae TaxID=1714016 RepID=A0A1E7DRS0_9BACI|nr:hypothetical protein BA724_02925 [Domibacillus iocasae]